MAGDCIRLTAVERVKIELGLRDGLSLTAIAAELGRPKGTMSKEIARNGGRGFRRPAGQSSQRGTCWKRLWCFLRNLNPPCYSSHSKALNPSRFGVGGE